MTVDHFHENGETLVADSLFEEIGGKGINQAVAAARMGAEVSFLAAVGDDADGRKCLQITEKEGIDGVFAQRKGEKTTCAFILTDKTGENRVTGYHGAELTVSDVESFADRIANSDLLLLQQEVPAAVNEAAAAIAQKHGVKVILNPAPIREISPDLAGKVWLVTPNQHEAAGICHLQFPHCITTLGGDGCCIDGRITVPATAVTAVDTTGAGDTFNGVLAAGLAAGLDMENACRQAVFAAGLSVTRRGVLAAIPYKNEIERITKND